MLLSSCSTDGRNILFDELAVIQRQDLYISLDIAIDVQLLARWKMNSVLDKL